MPTKDITRKAVERAATNALKAIDRFKDTIPLGPNQVQMSRTEIQRELRKAEGQKLLAFMEMLDASEFREMVGKVQDPKQK